MVISAGAAGLAPVLPACGGGPSRPVEEVFPQSVASGDPRETSIVLWTRAVPEGGAGDADVTLELASDEASPRRWRSTPACWSHARRPITASARRSTGLTAGTTYFYRFTHAGTRSRVGRFRTAPAGDADTPVRFAFVSCQDYVGRYYNTLLRLLDDEHDDLAFVLHLGDYVYETTGDPGFMMTGSERIVELRAPEEAIALGSGDGVYYAARSLSNYRDLYRTYRSDPILQRLHERFSFICIWDDHEFSDDSWQDHGTYSDGLREEQDTERRRASEQAWWEYTPAAPEDAAAGLQEVDPSELVPSVIGRAFRFGRHLSLAVTDYRSFRPDHPTPEDAFPGAVVLDEAEVQAALARLESGRRAARGHHGRRRVRGGRLPPLRRSRGRSVRRSQARAGDPL
ncbi:MAG: alkaline phosphatase D family protein [Sandaracinaceae bacterium]|nr:alkaline phosphatase D family protein [Sandaracinaceae bacterium]